MIETTSYLELLLTPRFVGVVILLAATLLLFAIFASIIFTMRDKDRYPMPKFGRFVDWIHTQADRFFLWFMDTITRTKRTENFGREIRTLVQKIEEDNSTISGSTLQHIEPCDTVTIGDAKFIARGEASESSDGMAIVALMPVDDTDEDDEATCIFIDGKMFNMSNESEDMGDKQ